MVFTVGVSLFKPLSSPCVVCAGWCEHEWLETRIGGSPSGPTSTCMGWGSWETPSPTPIVQDVW